MTSSPLYDTLRRLAKDSGLNAKEIAKDARVAYQPLNRFLNRGGRNYPLPSLMAVYHTLTGEHLIPAERMTWKFARKLVRRRKEAA